jgi:hypothetical protein
LFYDSALTTSSLTWDNPGGSSSGTGIHYYEAFVFQVDAAGTYVFEMASPNTTGTPSNALDTYLRIHDTTWDPNSAPSAGSITSNDDFTGSLTVLPGPYGAFITSASTGFSGTQPGSRISTGLLAANTDYWLVMTSFRNTDFVGTSTTAQATGDFYVGMGGPGNVVPEPGTFVAIGIGILGLAIARRRK